MNQNESPEHDAATARGRFQFGLSTLFRLHLGVAGLLAAAVSVYRLGPLGDEQRIIASVEFLCVASLLSAFAYWITRRLPSRYAAYFLTVAFGGIAGTEFSRAWGENPHILPLLGMGVGASWLVGFGWLHRRRATITASETYLAADGGVNDDSPQGRNVQEEKTPANILQLVGAVLLAIGFLWALRRLSFALLAALSEPLSGWAFGWVVAAGALTLVLPARVLRTLPRASVWLLVAAWFLSVQRELISRLDGVMDRWDDRSTTGLMLAGVGLLLLLTNGRQGDIQRWIESYRALIHASWSKHPKPILAAGLLVLWLLNPTNSHETCVKASALSEKMGCYGLALHFTRLGRNVFPPQTWCGTCMGELDWELRARLRNLQRKQSGLPPIPQRPAIWRPPWQNASPPEYFWRASDAEEPWPE